MKIKMTQRKRVDFNVTKASVPSGVESFTGMYYVGEVFEVNSSIGNQLVTDGYATATTDAIMIDLMDRAEFIPADPTLFLGAA